MVHRLESLSKQEIRKIWGHHAIFKNFKTQKFPSSRTVRRLRIAIPLGAAMPTWPGWGSPAYSARSTRWGRSTASPWPTRTSPRRPSQPPSAPINSAKWDCEYHVNQEINIPLLNTRITHSGLCNAPSTYARLVQLVLRGIPPSVALPFLDDLM